MRFNYNGPTTCLPLHLNSVNPLGQWAIKILGLMDAQGSGVTCRQLGQLKMDAKSGCYLTV